jgi:hypothetical protein
MTINNHSMNLQAAYQAVPAAVELGGLQQRSSSPLPQLASQQQQQKQQQDLAQQPAAAAASSGPLSIQLPLGLTGLHTAEEVGGFERNTDCGGLSLMCLPLS